MVTSYKEFRAELGTRNVSRPNLYEIVINPAPKVQPSSSVLRLMNMFCSHAQTPMSMLSVNDNYVEAGNRRKYAHNHDNSNLVLQFYSDQDNQVKGFFDGWLKYIHPRNRKFNWPADYTAESISVYILNLQGERVYQYKYKNVFPKQVFSMEVGHGMHGQAQTFGVEFVYEWVEDGKPEISSYQPPATPVPAKQSDNREVTQTTQPSGVVVDQMGNVIVNNS